MVKSCSAGGRDFLLRVAFHGRLESVGVINYTTLVNPAAFAANLCPIFRSGNSCYLSEAERKSASKMTQEHSSI
jgi:hypothetical protein